LRPTRLPFFAGTGRPPVRAACARGSSAKCSSTAMNGKVPHKPRTPVDQPTRMPAAQRAVPAAFTPPWPRGSGGRRCSSSRQGRRTPPQGLDAGAPRSTRLPRNPCARQARQRTRKLQNRRPGAVETGPGTGRVLLQWGPVPPRRAGIRIGSSHSVGRGRGHARPRRCGAIALGRRAPE